MPPLAALNMVHHPAVSASPASYGQRQRLVCVPTPVGKVANWIMASCLYRSESASYRLATPQFP